MGDRETERTRTQIKNDFEHRRGLARYGLVRTGQGVQGQDTCGSLVHWLLCCTQCTRPGFLLCLFKALPNVRGSCCGWVEFTTTSAALAAVSLRHGTDLGGNNIGVVAYTARNFHASEGSATQDWSVTCTWLRVHSFVSRIGDHARAVKQGLVPRERESEIEREREKNKETQKERERERERERKHN